MRKGRRFAAALLLALLTPLAQSYAQSRAYGGSGEDMLTELAQGEGGLFAVGMTASDDGDLSARTRSGEAGWALCLRENGERRWSYASAHTGLARMTAPAALPDGRYSLVLTDETAQRGEWILLAPSGKASMRTEIGAALPEDGMYTVVQYLLCSEEPASLAVILRRGDEVWTVILEENGDVRGGEPAHASGEGRAASDGLGGLIWASSQDGRLSLVRLDAQAHAGFSYDGWRIRAVTDVLMQEDGSVVCCGALEEDGGFLVRVSCEGEVIFCLATPQALCHICQTETGFAAFSGGAEPSLLFVDEDGGVLGMEKDVPAEVLDLAGVPDGAALLTHTAGRRQPQAVITSVLLSGVKPVPAQSMPEELTQASAPQKQAAIDDASAIDDGASELMASGGKHIVCRDDGLGVRVTLVDGDGQTVWSTRTPIHTAADALQWLCAAYLEDGSVLLGGRYLSGEGDQLRQEGVTALLNSDGVLRRIETVEGAGAVTAIATEPDVVLYLATGSLPSAGTEASMPYSP